MDFSAVWGILPEQAPDIIRRFGNLDAVRQKVIIPQCESICRNSGSKLGAVALLVGKSRQQFQADVDEAFKKILTEKGISLLYGLVRHIYIPKEVREPIQKGYVANELSLTRTQETTTAKMEANLREAEQTVLLEAAKITEGTKKLVAETKANGQKEAETIAAETEKKVAAIDLKCAQFDAQKTVALGEAENASKRMQQEAKAQLFELAVKAFGDPTAYTKWQFAQGLPEDIELKMIYSGPGTLWTDLKGLTPVLNVKPDKARKIVAADSRWKEDCAYDDHPDNLDSLGDSLAVVNIPSLIRMLARGSAQAGKLGRRLEEADPLALLNQAVDDGVASIQNAKKGLENYRALILSVQRQVENGEKEKARLESRIREAIDAGDPNRTAQEYAMMLADVEQNIAANREQLQRHKETYENFAKQVEVGQSRVLAARQKADAAGPGIGAEQARKGNGPLRPRLFLQSPGIGYRFGACRGTDLPEDRRQPRRRPRRGRLDQADHRRIGR